MLAPMSPGRVCPGESQFVIRNQNAMGVSGVAWSVFLEALHDVPAVPVRIRVR